MRQISPMDEVDLKSGTLGDEVYDRVIHAIDRGDPAPGSAVNQSALGARFGVSPGPVREPVRRPQGIQLVTRESFAEACGVELTLTEHWRILQAIRRRDGGLAEQLVSHIQHAARDVAELFGEASAEGAPARDAA